MYTMDSVMVYKVFCIWVSTVNDDGYLRGLLQNIQLVIYHDFSRMLNVLGELFGDYQN